MITKTKILIGILVIVVLIVGGWWVWMSQTVKGPVGVCGPEVKGSNYDISYCDRSCNLDNDCQYTCSCGAINKNETCHDEGIIYDCVDHYVKCEEKKCIALEEKSTKQEVTIATDKTEYALGEKAKIIVRNNLDKPIWYVDYVCPPSWQLEIQENSNWKSIAEFSPQLFRYCKEGEKFCRKGYIEEYDYCIPPWIKRAQDLVKSLVTNSEISKIWSLRNYIYHNGHTVEGLAPGNYRLSFTYGFTQDAYNTDLLYSNEFRVKKGLWRKISDACKEDKEFIEGVRSDPECLKGEEFRCVDGWGGTTYYDKRQVSTSTIESATKWPVDAMPSFMPDEAEKELSNATIAVYSQSSCACEKPIGYKILIKDKLEEVTCEEFYQFLQNYESSCGECILMWSYGCC